MAYDNLTTPQLAAEERVLINTAENACLRALAALTPAKPNVAKARQEVNAAQNAMTATLNRHVELEQRIQSMTAQLLASAARITELEGINAAQAATIADLEAQLAACTCTPAPTPTPTPTPGFEVAPSITYAGSHVHVGDTLTANDGSAAGATSYTRRWLVGDVVLGTGPTVVADRAGDVVLEVTATGPGLSITALSAAVHVAASHVPPPGTGDVLASSVPSIPSNFNTADWIAPAGVHTEVHDEGAVRLTGNVAKYAYADPLVFPGQATAGHLHEFLGNTAIDGFSTYETLRTSGNGTTEGNPINRSAYWKPPLLLRDQIVVPEWTAVYYKRARIGAPLPRGAQIAPLPRGLRMIGRYATYAVSGKTAELKDLAEVRRLAVPGDEVVISIGFPFLWDGVRVDCDDHEAHVAFPIWNPGGWWEAPPTHPFLFPTITLKSLYTVLPGEDWSEVELASDRMMGAPAGTTGHGDYWEAWDEGIFRQIEDALDKGRDCNGGDLGNGSQLKRPPGFTFNQRPSRIPISSVPIQLIP